MSLSALVNGVLYTRAKSISVNRSLRNLVGWFDITSSASENDAFPIKIGDRIKIVENETRQPFLTGFVEQLQVRQSDNDHEITITGRDITADLLDSTLRKKQFTGPIGLVDLVRRVIQEQGLALQVVSEADELPQIKANELVSGEIGQSAFEFLEKYARHVQALLTTNAAGNVLVMRASPVASGASLIRLTGSPLNNIVSSSVTYNSADRFRDYVCQSQLPDSDSAQSIFTDQAVDQNGSASDPEARAGRFYEFESRTTLDADACRNAASLEANIRRASSFDYQASYPGIINGVQINRLIGVRDDFAGVSDQLLLTDVATQFDQNQGTVTRIGATFSDAFTLDAQRQRLEDTRSEDGGKFTL